MLIPVTSAAGLRLSLDTLAGHDVQATLVVPAGLAQHAPAMLRTATHAGHELAGQGDPARLALLEAVAAQRVTVWDARDLPWSALRSLAKQGSLPAPPRPQPEPGQTVELRPSDLADRLTALRESGYRPVPLRQLPGLRRARGHDLMFLAYQRLVEDRFTRNSGVIDLIQRADGVMRIAPHDHAPAPLPLAPGTPTAELHLHSPRIVGLASRGALGAYRAYQRSLRDVAQALQTMPQLQQAQAVFAVTLFHAPLAQSGFTLLELPPMRARWYALGFRLIRLMYGTARTPSEESRKWPGWPVRPFWSATAAD
ncbi:Sectered polysaccharide deacetylase [Deinococcus malanensis]|uniref:YkoP family protein n=1 Tax=Deinococcus malanensis TaxID=1706855 RepID=UPI00363D20CF